MALTAPLLEFTSTDLPLLLPQLWLEAMLPLADTVPTAPVLSTVPRYIDAMLDLVMICCYVVIGTILSLIKKIYPLKK